MKQLVSVVVPLLKNTTQSKIKESLEVLKQHDVIWIAGENAILPDWTTSVVQAIVYRFEDKYFQSEEAFTRLLLSRKLYERFDWCEFIFLLHTDTFVAKDELTYWCKQGYDLVQPASDSIQSNLFTAYFKGRISSQKELSMTNFTSLRRVDRFSAMMKKLHTKAVAYCDQSSIYPKSDWFFWEQNTHPWKSALRVPTSINRHRFGIINPHNVEINHLFIVVQ